MKVVVIAVVALMLGACSPVRASSRSVLTEGGSMLGTGLPPQGAGKALVEQFSKRGFVLMDRREVSDDGMVLKFKGSRSAITSVTHGSGSSEQYGSVFYARILAIGAHTQIYLLGKPTLDDEEVCSDEDADPSLKVDPCTPLTRPDVWTGRAHLSGREEAECIHGIQTELELAGLAQGSPVTPSRTFR